MVLSLRVRPLRIDSSSDGSGAFRFRDGGLTD